MPYIQRSPAGHVIALLLNAPEPHFEWLAADHPEVLRFLTDSDAIGQGTMPHDVLATLDRAMIRVLEDLVDVLVDKHIIQLSDLPEQARTKVAARKEVRRTLPSAHTTSTPVGLDDIV